MNQFNISRMNALPSALVLRCRNISSITGFVRGLTKSYKVLYLFLKNKTSYKVLYFIEGIIFF